eukprot:gene13016-biopygen18533
MPPLPHSPGLVPVPTAWMRPTYQQRLATTSKTARRRRPDARVRGDEPPSRMPVQAFYSREWPCRRQS